MINQLKSLLIKNLAMQSGRNKATRAILYLLMDSVFIFLTLCLSSFLFNPVLLYNFPVILNLYIISTSSSLASFLVLGLYSTIARNSSLEICISMAVGSSIVTTLTLISSFALGLTLEMRFHAFFFCMMFFSLLGSRLFVGGLVRDIFFSNKKRIAVYGAGSAGAQTIQALNFSPDFTVVMLIDDNPLLAKRKMFGLKILNFKDAKNKLKEQNISTVLLAMPSIESATKKQIIDELLSYSITVKTIPSLTNLIEGRPNFSHIQDLSVEDLLGRDTVQPKPELLSKNIKNKKVLVTGAGGSIGKELCKQIVQQSPSALYLNDISEAAIYNLLQDIEEASFKFNVKIKPLIGSVACKKYISTNLKNLELDTVFHAAAYKHVPLMEKNKFQAIKNNALGTKIFSEMCVLAGVKNFTLISTDKAINPTNIMGASKRLAELVCLATASKQKLTRFSIVRFGNVLGSSGSVIPLFEKQIKEKKSITVTHPEITRYFMSNSEAAELVIQASSLTSNGDIFVLDMGEPIKIVDLAHRIIRLNGLTPTFEKSKTDDDTVHIEFIGLRPGEKMYEELSYSKNLLKSPHPRIMIAPSHPSEIENFSEVLSRIEIATENNDETELIALLEQSTHYSETR